MTADLAFKNFHRLLCERFGYRHDEQDWQRDQLSLIEFIAAKIPTPAEAHGKRFAPAGFQGTDLEYAGWLADKLPNTNDYGKEAALLLVKQAEALAALSSTQPKETAGLTGDEIAAMQEASKLAGQMLPGWTLEQIIQTAAATQAPAPAPEDALTKALAAAAQSLQTISSLAGREFWPNTDMPTHMGHMSDVRAYALNRAKVASEALDAHRSQCAAVAHESTAERLLTDLNALAQRVDPHMYGLPIDEDGVHQEMLDTVAAWARSPHQPTRHHSYGQCTITGPEEDIAFIFRHLPDIDEAHPDAGELPTLDEVLRLADEHAEESYENGDRRFDRGGVYQFAKDLLRLYGAAVVATQAAQDVLTERQRQIHAEGWTPEHDDEHDKGELALAAGSYASAASGWTSAGSWPWSLEWWKPGSPRRMLVKAGALILAEIERLDRASKPPVQGSEQ